MAELKRYDVGNDIHYKGLVSSVSEKERLTVTNDVYTESGQKLVAKGTQINAQITANLAKHKLQSPIDDYVQMDNSITSRVVINDVNDMVVRSNTLKLLFKDLVGVESIEKLLVSHEFPNTIAFKLSVAKSEREDIYEHSLLILCISYFIACKAGMSKQEIRSVLLAALFHDIGLLHLDPEYFRSGRKLSSHERKYLNVHVIISSLIIEPYPEYQGMISNAVLEHHERLDGSGYPHGKKGEALCALGQILAISEVVASRFNHEHECVEVDRLELLLNMNSRKLNSDMYTYFNVLFKADYETESQVEQTEDNMKEKLGQLASILNGWLSFSDKQTTSPLHLFIGSYIDTLYESLTQAGVNFDNLDFLMMMVEQDELMRRHTDTIIKESTWQLSNLIEELKRRNKYQAAVDSKNIGNWLVEIEAFTA